MFSWRNSGFDGIRQLFPGVAAIAAGVLIGSYAGLPPLAAVWKHVPSSMDRSVATCTEGNQILGGIISQLTLRLDVADLQPFD